MVGDTIIWEELPDSSGYVLTKNQNMVSAEELHVMERGKARAERLTSNAKSIVPKRYLKYEELPLEKS